MEGIESFSSPIVECAGIADKRQARSKIAFSCRQGNILDREHMLSVFGESTFYRLQKQLFITVFAKENNRLIEWIDEANF
jgi:succinate dehydrogenase flavin-adding protein (antitoxin of CptAB toxin-antitoxin module)